MSKDSSETEEAAGKKTRLIKFRRGAEKDHQRPKNFGGPIRIIATVLLIFILSQILATSVVGLALNFSRPDQGLISLEDSPMGEFFYIFLAEALAISMVFWVLKRRGLGLSSIGLGRAPQWKDLGRAFLGFMIFYGLLIGVGLLLNQLDPNLFKDERQDVGFKNISNSLDELLALIALVVFPPLGEETLIRGYLYSGLRSLWRFWPALLITSLVFAAAHLQPGNSTGLIWGAALNTFILSVVLVYLREKSGALYAGIMVHAANNLIAFAVHFNT